MELCLNGINFYIFGEINHQNTFRMEEKKFLKKMQWHTAEMANLVSAQRVDGIEFKTIYKHLDGNFWRTEFKTKLMGDEIDIEAEQEKYSQEAQIDNLLNPNKPFQSGTLRYDDEI